MTAERQADLRAKSRCWWAWLVFLFLGSGLAVGYILYFGKAHNGYWGSTREMSAGDVQTAFLSEIYGLIRENYWNTLTEEQLSSLFKLGVEELIGSPQVLDSTDKAGVEALLEKVVGVDSGEKKDFVVKLADVVLANLEPFGRSRLYGVREERNLSNRVRNIDPGTDQYAVLGVDSKASRDEIKRAYEEKVEILESEKGTSPGARQKLKEAARAYEVLRDAESREVYDQSGIEPTLTYRLLRPDIFYIHIEKFSPTTLEELERAAVGVDDTAGPASLVLDLRGNVGGAIDGLPFFLGPFIGPDQYAYQFFHQGKRTDFKTQTGWMPSLVRYKKVVVLVNEGTQSSAELFAATLKRYNAGVLVGVTTKGWGTVERVFPLRVQLNSSERYSVFLTHSLTLRDDGQPIEGRGVDPQIDINDADWGEQLFAHFHCRELVEAVEELVDRDRG